MVTAGLLPRAALAEVRTRLTAAGCPDAAFDARELVRLALGDRGGRDPRWDETPLTAAEAARLEVLCARREAREPLQYLCGEWPFLNFTLAVGPGVLCPRADSEVVAEAAAELLRGVAAPRVLDLCAGTGCLGLGVKMFCPDAQVTSLEKSPEAFAYLEQNAAQALAPLGIAAPAVTPVRGDLFTYWQILPERALDLILSNPPYLTAQEMRTLQPEVAQEPAMALEAGEDGLVFYRAIAAHYRRALRPGGALALEIGWQQAAAVEELLRAAGWEQIETRKDYGGNDRCVLARRGV
jgi:release factor glutamine methyltransferase